MLFRDSEFDVSTIVLIGGYGQRPTNADTTSEADVQYASDSIRKCVGGDSAISTILLFRDVELSDGGVAQAFYT